MFSAPINFAGIVVRAFRASFSDNPLLIANLKFLKKDFLSFESVAVIAKVIPFSFKIFKLNGAVSQFFKSCKLIFIASSGTETS